ncbi:hypothetical protein J2S43_003241 [Catenuloplanes nepalensis]|uniref:Secreted protein n=1 Tax=Catenuloplanes nepalensis TaxID=587533 RepID=A0ABT9MTH2_9ACTN|nr:hypothetical protein [Catenuloplanes nepalensis]MDP9794729.1 hypothetical protein [Catenuloplanes nepalensis]
MIRRILGVLAAAFVAVALVPAAAQAAPNPYSPGKICGAGYTVKRQAKVADAVVYQLSSGTWQCVVTIKTAKIGKPSYVGAGLLVRGGRGWALDDGTYRYYAGPVKQKGACASVRGASGTSAVSFTC